MSATLLFKRRKLSSDSEQSSKLYSEMIKEYLTKGTESNHNLELVQSQTGERLDICLISLLYNEGDIVNAIMSVDDIINGLVVGKKISQVTQEVSEYFDD